MPKKQKSQEFSANLRHRAEQHLVARVPTATVSSDIDSRRLLHELEVHQIELEMQNAELRLARDESEAVLEKYTDLYEFAPVGYFTLSPDGTIRQVNLTGATLVGTERSRLIGYSFVLLISPAFREGFQVFLEQVFLESSKRSMEFEVLIPGLPPKPVNIEVQRSADAKECRVAVVDITGRKREEEILRRHAQEEAQHLAELAAQRQQEELREIERQRELTAATDALNLTLQAENRAHVLAAAGLRESEEFIRSIIESSADCIKVLDLEGNLVSILHGAQELLGIDDIRPYLDQPWTMFWEGGDRQAAQDAIAAAAAGGEGNFVGFFRTLRDEPKWWDVRISPVLDATGRPARLLVVSRDVTVRKRVNLNNEFLASVSQDLWCLTGVEEIMRAIGAKIGAHLDLSVCAFVEINEGAKTVDVTHDWHREDVPGLVGHYQQKEFVEAEFTRLARAGEIIVVNDTGTDARTTPENFAALKIGSFICSPLVRDGEWRYSLCLYHATPYAWPAEEIELARELTARIWTRLERIRAEDALRASEERYRTLFTSIDEGFCVIEMIYDAHGKAVDWLYLEVNPSFEKQTGMVDIIGKRVRELLPGQEEYWFEIFGKVAITGEPVRFINEAKALQSSWFDLYAFKIGEPESRKLAILFTNITERRRTEHEVAEKARLLDLSNDAILVRDMEGHIRYWNQGATVLYGWSREEAMGKISHHLLQTEFPTPIDVVTEELHRTNHWLGELMHAKRDGQRITVLARKTLVRDGQGEPVAVMENLTDISERKQAELAQRHLSVLTASNLKLNQEILQRQAVEKDLKTTQEAQTLLLKQSILQQEQLRGISHQILQAQEEERKRISRELHDVVVQTLVGISVHVAALAQKAEGVPRSFQLKVARTHRLVEKSVETVHRFARELRPTVLDDLGLIPALHDHLKEYMERTGIRASLKAFADIEKSPGPLRTAIYRVAQEALANVARHANASHVEVNLQNLDGIIRLEISDNGTGFEIATATGGKSSARLGLLGMKERVEMIGGSFTVESAPGHPTTIRADFPPHASQTITPDSSRSLS